jgi:hypothetical protein
VRCSKCGAVHHADGTVISPVMTPAYKTIDTICTRTFEVLRSVCGPCASRLSPWQFPYTRPLMRGYYDVRFGELILPLMWCDGEFRVPDGRKVNCRTLSSWRGGWAE